ncbi:MAG: VOC family protein [Kofleriaceae bacterium]|nr:VOC family protein [Kofleriaceae bacterium]
MQALELDHAAIQIEDVAASLAFYRDVLGLTLADAMSGDDWGGHPWLMMIFDAHDGRQLALTSLGGAKVPRPVVDDVVHHAFGAKALAPWRDRLRDTGVEFTEEDHGAQQSIYFKDPSGNMLEITTRPRLEPQPADAVKVIETWLAST